MCRACVCRARVLEPDSVELISDDDLDVVVRFLLEAVGSGKHPGVAHRTLRAGESGRGGLTLHRSWMKVAAAARTAVGAEVRPTSAPAASNWTAGEGALRSSNRHLRYLA